MHGVRAVFICIICVLTASKAKSKITDNEYRLMPKLFHLDNFDNCMSLGEKALYCTTMIQLAPKDSQNKSNTWNIIQKAIRDPRNYRHDLLRHGTCVPDSCPEINTKGTDRELLIDGLARCYTLKYEHLGLEARITGIHCQSNQEEYPIDKYDIGVAIVLGLIIWIVAFASFYEGRARYKTKEEYEKITNTTTGRVISCFSIPRNWGRLTNMETKPQTDQLRCLNGMRFYTLQAVILVHAAACTLASSIENPTFAENLTRKPENILLINGLAAIQTFMIISGLLISHHFAVVIGSGRKFHIRYIILSFINRYIRLTPCLLVMVALHSTWLYHIGRGPMWDKALGTEYRNCRGKWWVNLLYINNYYDAENMCMQHAWYLATDTQLFLVSLIVIMFMWIFQRRVKFILGLAITVGFALPGIINYYNDYDITIRMYPEALYDLFLKIPHWHAMYSSSIVNFGGYALGITCGYIIYSKGNKKIFTKKIYVAIWWLLTFGLPFGVIFYGILIYQDDYQYSRIGAAIYVVTYRLMFALGISLIIIGTAEGIGWLARDCLHWPPIQILGRLTYSIYLVHVPLIRIRAGQARLPSYLTYYTMITQTSGDALIALIFGTLLALFIELPVSALQKLMVPQLKHKEGAGTDQEQFEKSEKEEVIEYNQRV